jgi:hypothetical protein
MNLDFLGISATDGVDGPPAVRDGLDERALPIGFSFSNSSANFVYEPRHLPW